MRLSPFHILAFSLSGALITGVMLTSVLVPQSHDGKRTEYFDRTGPCTNCWDRATMDAWIKSGQDGAFNRV